MDITATGIICFGFGQFSAILGLVLWNWRDRRRLLVLESAFDELEAAVYSETLRPTNREPVTSQSEADFLRAEWQQRCAAEVDSEGAGPGEVPEERVEPTVESFLCDKDGDRS